MRPAALGIAFGFVVMVGGLASTGAGHGSYLPIALGAAPLSLIPSAGFFAAPVWWGLVGFLADRRLPLAVLGLLIVHTICALAILWLGSPMEPGDASWHYLWNTIRVFPVIVVPSLGIYLAGLAVAWAWTFRALAFWIES